MDQVWARVEAWLAAHAPAVAAGLNPPASEDELAETERQLGVRLPESVRAAYLRHDGQSADAPGLFDGWEWLSLESVRHEWKIWKRLLDGGDFKGMRSDGDGAVVRDDWWNAAWVPLTHSGSGDHHCLDLDPGPSGTPGQIIRMWHDDGARPVEAAGFAAWLTAFADDLEAGRFVASEDGGSLSRRDD